jgi:hypothetical protein
MPDLKLDTEAAVAKLGKQLDSGIESLRREAERLTGDIRTCAEVLDGPMKLNIADADAACVVELFVNYPTRNIEFRIDSGNSGRVELASPLPIGRYRAVILMNRLPDAEPSR